MNHKNRNKKRPRDKYIAIFVQNNIKKSASSEFFPILGHQNPGFGPGSGSAIRKKAECGSTTLVKRQAGGGGGGITIGKGL
jgi:hypothetical protein